MKKIILIFCISALFSISFSYATPDPYENIAENVIGQKGTTALILEYSYYNPGSHHLFYEAYYLIARELATNKNLERTLIKKGTQEKNEDGVFVFTPDKSKIVKPISIDLVDIEIIVALQPFWKTLSFVGNTMSIFTEYRDSPGGYSRDFSIPWDVNTYTTFDFLSVMESNDAYFFIFRMEKNFQRGETKVFIIQKKDYWKEGET